MKNFKFCLEKTTKWGRLGWLETPHGRVKTPVFMPVGTHGAVKALSPKDLEWLGAEMVLSNVYHLYLRPGIDLIVHLGGIHRFMGWNKPILTDSGGYQIFSLSKFVRIKEDGVEFRSYIDGSLHFLTPEDVISMQKAIGVDIAMSLDYCVPYPSDKETVEKAVSVTLNWAKRGKTVWDKEGGLFGIVQGGVFLDLRRRCAEELLEMEFDGYAIGGLSVGEEKEQTWEVVEFTCQLLPEDKPRYLMGMGTPQDIIEGVKRGVDIFDCVLPTRFARTGYLFTRWGKMAIKHAKYARDPNPIDPTCECYTCRNFSRAYLRHLFLSRELLAYYLNTIHNLYFYFTLIRKIRQALEMEDMKELESYFINMDEEENFEDLVGD